MMIGDLPSITNSAYTSSTYSPTTTTNGLGLQALPLVAAAPVQVQRLFRPGKENVQNLTEQLKQEIKNLANSSRRIVKVIIIDPDDRVPLDKCILYSGDEKLTDLTDQELFFEVEIKSLLDKHNEYRKTVVDKTVKERTENLDAIKIRDLRMVVVDVAKF